MEECFEAFLYAVDDDPDLWNNHALAALNNSEYAAAEASYKRALELSPDFIAAYANLADLYRVQGRDQEGERLLREALAKHPDEALLHHTLGLVLVRLRRGDSRSATRIL